MIIQHECSDMIWAMDGKLHCINTITTITAKVAYLVWCDGVLVTLQFCSPNA